jgi:hypothetical protein
MFQINTLIFGFNFTTTDATIGLYLLNIIEVSVTGDVFSGLQPWAYGTNWDIEHALNATNPYFDVDVTSAMGWTYASTTNVAKGFLVKMKDYWVGVPPAGNVATNVTISLGTNTVWT